MAALLDLTSDLNLAPQLLGQGLADIESQASATCLPITGLFDTVETVKDMRQVLGGNAHALINDMEADSLAFFLDMELNATLLWRVLAGVLQEIEEDTG